MSTIPQRAPKSTLADSLLRKDSYDLFVYIEDEKLTAVYKKLISKIVDSSIRIRKIYTMKSKENVLTAFDKWKSLNDKLNKNVFIVDRDFDHLKGILVPNHPNLIELEYYTIENYLVTFEGVFNLIQVKASKFSDDEIIEMLEWGKWYDYINSGFKDLFISFAIAHKYGLLKNSSISPHRFLESNSYKINEDQVNKYINELKEMYEQKFSQDFEEEFKLVESHFIENGVLVYDKLIKGKYIHAAVFKYIHSIFDKKFDEDLSNVILADNIDLSKMDFMKQKILNL